MKTDEAQFDEVLKKMLSGKPQKTPEMKGKTKNKSNRTSENRKSKA
jgi:hypothetical protein